MAGVLEEPPIINGKMKVWTTYVRYPEVRITTNSHQYVTNKKTKVTNSIDKTTEYLNYNTKNYLVFSVNDLGLDNKNIQDIKLPWGADTLNNQWDEVIEDLGELRQQPYTQKQI